MLQNVKKLIKELNDNLLKKLIIIKMAIYNTLRNDALIYILKKKYGVVRMQDVWIKEKLNVLINKMSSNKLILIKMNIPLI